MISFGASKGSPPSGLWPLETGKAKEAPVVLSEERQALSVVDEEESLDEKHLFSMNAFHWDESKSDLPAGLPPSDQRF